MNKQYLLIVAVLSVFGLNAQIQENTTPSFSSSIGQKSISYTNQRAAGAPISLASIDTIWSDDFSDTTNWTYVGGTDEWNIANRLTSNLISQTFDSVLNSTSGGNFAIIDSDVSGATGSQDAILEYTGGTIDCSNYQAVRLIFETYFRQYQETRQVLISNDGGTIWDTINVLTQFGSGVTTPNVHTEIVDITAFAGGQSNVKIKFRYAGSFDWFWTIDDVKIVSAPQNDIALTQEYYNGISDNTYSTYYKMMPLRQADSGSVKFGVSFKNMGAAAQSNVHAIAQVMYNGVAVYSESTDSVALSPSASTSLDFANSFYPNNGLGLYSMNFESLSDSVDEFPGNSTIQNSIIVSSNQYRRDNDNVTNSNWFNVTNHWEMLLKYEFFTDDTIVGVSTFFPFDPNAGRGVFTGDSISYYIYNATNLDSAISVNSGYIVQQSDINNWITLPMPVTKITPGVYFVGFEIYNNTSSVGTSSILNSQTAPITVLIRQDATASNDPWGYTTSFTPFIRLYTKSDSACNGVNIVIDDTIFDNATLGAIDITVTGGAPTYTYYWIGPDSFTANTQNIDDLVNRGMYYVTVTDVFGCEGRDSSLVAGSVSVNEIDFAKELKLYPNPNKGEFTVSDTDVASGIYTFTILNMIGQSVVQQQMQVDQSFNLPMNISSLKSGIYFLKISNTKGQSQVLKFVVE